MKCYQVIKVDHQIKRGQRRALAGTPFPDAAKPIEILHTIAFKPIKPMKVMKRLLRFWM